MSSGPPLAPVSEDQQTVYLVLDAFGGRLGRSWRETDEARADRAALIVDLLDGQYNDPVRVVAFNTAEGWARDVSQEIADLVACFDIPPFLQRFVDQHGSRQAVP